MEVLTMINEDRRDSVSEIGMPEIDGDQFMREIKAVERANGLRIRAAALTAFARVETRKRVLEAGYAAHLSKPSEPAELVAPFCALAREGGSR
jgi:CheY-like chemotaxis protein